jgi:putative Mn2+ efflux pump MntP
VFGGFQALMPLIGWLLGENFLQYISSVDHWVAFGLLLIVGGKMLWEAFFGDDEERVCSVCIDDCACEGGSADGSASSTISDETPTSSLGSGAAEAGSAAVALAPAKPATRAYPKLAVGSLIMLGIAESIDALAVGITFPVANVNVWAAITLIGVVTTALSAVAVWIGHKLGARFSKPAEILGGIILIAIGVQVLIEHLG